jgi:NTE family protein
MDVDAGLAARAGGLMRSVLKRLSSIGAGQTSDLVSYLLFDGEFAGDLIRLGMHDADAQRNEIIEFFK